MPPLLPVIADISQPHSDIFQRVTTQSREENYLLLLSDPTSIKRSTFRIYLPSFGVKHATLLGSCRSDLRRGKSPV
jgi:hypothetical protein